MCSVPGIRSASQPNIDGVVTVGMEIENVGGLNYGLLVSRGMSCLFCISCNAIMVTFKIRTLAHLVHLFS